MEKRKCPRFQVRFRSSFSSSQMIGGQGTIVDLSLGGCRISSDIDVSPGTVLEVRLHLDDQKAPLDIALAAVRWRQGDDFGVEFLQLRMDAQDRIRQIVEALEREQTV